MLHPIHDDDVALIVEVSGKSQCLIIAGYPACKLLKLSYLKLGSIRVFEEVHISEGVQLFEQFHDDLRPGPGMLDVDDLSPLGLKSLSHLMENRRLTYSSLTGEEDVMVIVLQGIDDLLSFVFPAQEEAVGEGFLHTLEME